MYKFIIVDVFVAETYISDNALKFNVSCFFIL